MNIGQLTSTQLRSDYNTEIKFDQRLISTKDITIIELKDQCLFLSGKNVLSSQYSYYLKFQVYYDTENVQKFSIKLQNEDPNIDNIQNIKRFEVKKGPKELSNTNTENTELNTLGIESDIPDTESDIPDTESDIPSEGPIPSTIDTTIPPAIFELIFTPNSTYNQLVFELERTNSDFYTKNHQGGTGRLMEIEILQFDQISNVINDYLAVGPLKQIGIQAPPGLLFCINGEEIRVGRSGIYELYHKDIKIESIGFAMNNPQDFFIMDYKY